MLSALAMIGSGRSVHIKGLLPSTATCRTRFRKVVRSHQSFCKGSMSIRLPSSRQIFWQASRKRSKCSIVFPDSERPKRWNSWSTWYIKIARSADGATMIQSSRQKMLQIFLWASSKQLATHPSTTKRSGQPHTLKLQGLPSTSTFATHVLMVFASWNALDSTTQRVMFAPMNCYCSHDLKRSQKIFSSWNAPGS